MKLLYSNCLFRTIVRAVKQQLLLSLWLLLTVVSGPLAADEEDTKVEETKVIEVKLGDYRYMPGDIHIIAQQPVILRLTNTDLMTPHNFIIEDDSDGMDTNVDVSPGTTIDVHLMPLVSGEHTFYCSKKLLFFDSHREKGMEGKLIIEAE